MEKIITKKIKHKVIEAGFEEVITYKTKDGQEFEHDYQAIKHEESLIKQENFIKDFKVKNIHLSENDYIAIFVKDFSEETRKRLSNYFYNHFPFEDCEVGWNLVEVDESGDYTNVYCYDPKKFIEERKNDIQILERLITDDTEKPCERCGGIHNNGCLTV